MPAVPPSPELMSLMATVISATPPDLPPAVPTPGQSVDAWLAEVARVRSVHERSARVAAADLEGSADPPAPLPVGSVSDVEEGSVRARVYTPPGDGPFPVLMSFHGGGFWVGGGSSGMAAADPSCRLMCLELGAVVVQVDYRQAPEHRFPVPLEDCYAATCWVTDHADDLRIDPSRLVLCGPSAGANLTAGVALLSRDRGGPKARLIVLMVPCADATLASPSIDELGTGFDLTKEYIEAAWQLYLGPEGDRREPLASLLHHPDLSGLPPAHVVVGEFDPLRDDGLRLATRLAEAGGHVTTSRFPMGHGVVTPHVGQEYLDDVLGRLAAALRA